MDNVPFMPKKKLKELISKSFQRGPSLIKLQIYSIARTYYSYKLHEKIVQTIFNQKVNIDVYLKRQLHHVLICPGYIYYTRDYTNSASNLKMPFCPPPPRNTITLTATHSTKQGGSRGHGNCLSNIIAQLQSQII